MPRELTRWVQSQPRVRRRSAAGVITARGSSTAAAEVVARNRAGGENAVRAAEGMNAARSSF